MDGNEEDLFEEIVRGLDIHDVVVNEYGELVSVVGFEILLLTTDNPESQLFDAIAAYLDRDDVDQRPIHGVTLQYMTEGSYEAAPKLRALISFGEPRELND